MLFSAADDVLPELRPSQLVHHCGRAIGMIHGINSKARFYARGAIYKVWTEGFVDEVDQQLRA